MVWHIFDTCYDDNYIHDSINLSTRTLIRYLYDYCFVGNLQKDNLWDSFIDGIDLTTMRIYKSTENGLEECLPEDSIGIEILNEILNEIN